MSIKLTTTQVVTLRAIYALRGANYEKSLPDLDVMAKTQELRESDGAKNPKPVGRQLWTSKSVTDPNPTTRVWAMIGLAIRGKLPHNHPIEKKIRAFKEDSAAENARFKEENKKLKEMVKSLEGRVEKLGSEKSEATKDLKEYKDEYRNDQCEDAHYRINFEKIGNTNVKLNVQADNDRKTIAGLTLENSNLNQRIRDLEAMLSDAGQAVSGKVKSIKPPTILEAQLTGDNKSLTDPELRVQYIAAVEAKIEELETVARRKQQPDITIVFHDFNADTKALVDAGDIPPRSAQADNILFACHGVSPELREEVYRRAEPLTGAKPRVVIVSGKGKVARIPVKDRTNENDHDWFATRVREGKYRRTPIVAEREGYDTVIYRRLGDGN